MNDKPQNTLQDLNWDIQPERDLWADIDSNIRFSGKPKVDTTLGFAEVQPPRSKPWAPIAIAACSVMAVLSVVMSGLSLQRSNQTYQMQAKLVEFQQSHIALMEQQHQAVRAQFVSLLESQTSLNPTSMNELKATLATFDQASTQLKDALIAQPTNTKYATTLAETYQREAALLKKIQAQATQSI